MNVLHAEKAIRIVAAESIRLLSRRWRLPNATPIAGFAGLPLGMIVSETVLR